MNASLSDVLFDESIWSSEACPIGLIRSPSHAQNKLFLKPISFYMW